MDVTIRSLTRADGPALDAVFAGLGPRSRFFWFHTPVPRLTGGMRSALLDLDGRHRLALVAELPGGGDRAPIGIARLICTGARQGELAVAVVDRFHRRGVGTRLLEALGDVAAELGLAEIYGDVLPENDAVVRLLQQVFPGASTEWDDGVVRVRCPVGPVEPTHDDLLASVTHPVTRDSAVTAGRR